MKSDAFEKAWDQYQYGYYEDKLEEGLRYQDYVTRELYKRGIVIVGYSSRYYQNQHGENELGAEIKRDGLFRETNNLYIETKEKSHPGNNQYIKSGIHRGDNSWLFVIGDEKTIYVFSTKYLRFLEKKYRAVEKPTSHGFLMPIIEAEKYCIRKIEIEEPPCQKAVC